MSTDYDTNCIATFNDHEKAESAVHTLVDRGIAMKDISLIGCDFQSENHPIGFVHIKDRVRYSGKRGAIFGGVLGLIFAPALFVVPGIGPVLTGGIVSSAILGAIEGTAAGAALGAGISAVVAGLLSIGIPKAGAIRYETLVKAGKYLVVVHARNNDSAAAAELCKHLDGVESVDVPKRENSSK